MLFEGKDVIHANELLLCDSDETIYFVYENRINVMERRRDILMHATVNGIPVYIGLEIQSTINYSMPYRLLLYDTMTYHLQYKLIDKDHRAVSYTHLDVYKRQHISHIERWGKNRCKRW